MTTAARTTTRKEATTDGIPTHLVIGITAAKAVVDPTTDLKTRLRAAMERTREEGWILPTEEDQFKAAVGAVLLSATDDEKERITAEMFSLRDISALLSGVPVDLAEVLTRPQLEAVGLLAIWNSTKGDD